MIEVIVFAEGPSDEQFIKKVVAPQLRDGGVVLKPQTLNTSAHGKGGAINFDRLRFNVRNTLRQSATTYLTTFFDLYGLDPEMPGKEETARMSGPLQKALHIERALHAALLDAIGFRPERLIPYIQPYELEGLFFSNTDALSQTVPGWAASAVPLRRVRKSFETPEHINNGFETKPSARLGELLKPAYRKTTHAPLIGQHIGLGAILRECAHFAGWVQRLGQLRPL